jgi:hypothetical protein
MSIKNVLLYTNEKEIYMSKSNKPTVARFMKKFSLKVLIVAHVGRVAKYFTRKKRENKQETKTPEPINLNLD